MANSILCVHYYFPPLRSTAVIRNFKIASTFSEFFDDVFVITSDNHRRFPNQHRPLPENLHPSSVVTWDYRRLLSTSKMDSHNPTTKKSSKLFQYLLKIQKSFPFNLFLAEGNLIYIFQAYFIGKRLIEKNKIKTIYSSFGPYADHYVAYLLKRKFPHTKWIADFRDLQVEPIYRNVILTSLQRWMERKVLSRADKVTSISKGLVDQLSIYGRPTESIPRGVELRPIENQYEKFTISYTGSLYFNYRDPRRFFKVLATLIKEQQLLENDIQIIYAGRDGGQFNKWAKDYSLDNVVIDKGMLTEGEAKTIQNQSHINLLLTSSSTELQGVVTGKVFEYFEAGNPILCLINGVKDTEFESLFKKLNAGEIVYTPELYQDKMNQFILSKYKQWQSTGMVSSTINKTLLSQQFSWNYQVKCMLE